MSLFSLRESGWRGGINDKDEAVMQRTDGKGNPLELFKGGTGTGTPDDARGRSAGRAARAGARESARRGK